MSRESITNAINQATEELLRSPDMGANTNICDLVNQNPALGEPASSALKKRLSHKSPEVASLSLTLLDMLVKNCPKFHPFVATKEFMAVLLKLLETQDKGIFRRKLSHDDSLLRLEVKERTLVMIQQWAKAFARSVAYPIFGQTYDDLRRQGVVFPQPDKDETAPVFTPPVHVPKRPPPAPRPRREFTDPQCRAASENADLLHDMLTASNPKDDLKRNDLVQTLVGNVRTAQAHGMQRLEREAVADFVVDEILFVNDKLLEVMQYYDGLSRNEMDRYKAAPAASKTKDAAPADTPAKSSAKPRKPSDADAPRHEKKPSVAVPTLAPPPDDADGRGKGAAKKKKKSFDADDEESFNSSPAAKPQQSKPVVDLLGADIFDLAPAKPAQPAPVSSSGPAHRAAASNPFDLLDDVFGAPAPVKPNGTKAAPKPVASPVDDDDPFLALASRDAPSKPQQQSSAKPAQPAAPAKKPVVDEFDLLASR